MDVVVSSESWQRFVAFADQWRNHGLWRFEKELRAFAECEDWDWMPLGDKRRFHRWSLVLMQAAGRLWYHNMRREQLAEAGFKLWVYRCYDVMRCPTEHAAFDGVVLPPEHPFWSKYLPPNEWECACGIAGARSLRGAKRLGGDPDKPLPQWWREARGVATDFDGDMVPSFERVLELLIDGHFD